MIACELSALRYCPDSLAGEFALVGLLAAEKLPEGGYGEMSFQLTTHTARLSGFFSGDYRAEDWSAWRKTMIYNFNIFQKDGPIMSAGYPFSAIQDAVSPRGVSAFRWGNPFIAFGANRETIVSHWFHRLVMQHNESEPDEYVSDDAVWEKAQPIAEAKLKPALENHLFRFQPALYGDDQSKEPEQFRIGWRNGVHQVLDTLSFSVKQARTIKAKELRAIGRMWRMERRFKQNPVKCTLLLSPPSDQSLQPSYEEAKAEMREAPCVRKIIEPHQLEAFLAEAIAEAKPWG